MVFDPKNASLFFPELEDIEELVVRFNQAPPGGVIYYPTTFRSGILAAKMDCFVVKMGQGQGPSFRFYLAGYGVVALIEWFTKPWPEGPKLNSGF